MSSAKVKGGTPHRAKPGKKNRKFHRNERKCARYSLEKRHEKSHIRRIRRHIARYKDHSQGTRDALNRYLGLL